MPAQIDVSPLIARSRWERPLLSGIGAWTARALVVVCASALTLGSPPSSRAIVFAASAGAGLGGIEAVRWCARRRRGHRIDALVAANSLGHSRHRTAFTGSPALLAGAAQAWEEEAFVIHDADGAWRISTVALRVERAETWVWERWTCVSAALGVAELPHVVALSGDRSLPVSLNHTQRLTLEGDFPRHFTVYCATYAERDALYLLTPDVMAKLVDAGPVFSLEIVDDRMTFFRPGRFDGADPRSWSRLESVLDSLGQRARTRATRLGRTRPVVRLAPEGGAPAAPRIRTSISRSNRSNEIVGALCAVVVLAVFVWAWLH